jgi:hypothetical protein
MFSEADMHGRVYAFGDYDPRFPQAPRWHQMSGRILREGGTRPALRPDIEHPATKGWLLAMLREATGDAQATTGKSAYFDTWAAFYGSGDMRADAYQTTEGAALASALLAVWGAADVDDMGTDADRKPRAF